MGIGVSLLLIAAGAILEFAVTINDNSTGVDWNTVGVILMIVGAIGLVLSLLFWSSWGGFGGRRDDVVYDGTPRRRTIIER